DGTNPPPAEQLDATFDFSVLGNTLTLTVTNLTPENPLSDPALKINEVYFNTTADIQGLVLTEVIGSEIEYWDLAFACDGIHVNGFGLFDVSLIDGQGSLPHVIDPGETVTFVLGITGTGPFSDNNFIQLSTQVDSHVISYAAGKFYDGLPETSAYGATNVPEPASVCLLCLGALALLRKRAG
ncbi:MAG TPA: PEP-CTERM sorting domain-containing protein, partial [Sedimentisphaerales bacterium]|nr:PEP-CTERM sorting domain-containing protein [Sedimentisphaerales bacterium]